MSDDPTLPVPVTLPAPPPPKWRRRPAYLTRDDAGRLIITAFGASPLRVAEVLQAAGWTVIPPKESQ